MTISTANSIVSHHRPGQAKRLALAISVIVAATNAQAQEDTAPRAGGYSLQLEEVVVTAQKREENYMSVPLSVNAFTAEDMAKQVLPTFRACPTLCPA